MGCLLVFFDWVFAVSFVTECHNIFSFTNYITVMSHLASHFAVFPHLFVGFWGIFHIFHSLIFIHALESAENFHSLCGAIFSECDTRSKNVLIHNNKCDCDDKFGAIPITWNVRNSDGLLT